MESFSHMFAFVFEKNLPVSLILLSANLIYPYDYAIGMIVWIVPHSNNETSLVFDAFLIIVYKI